MSELEGEQGLEGFDAIQLFDVTEPMPSTPTGSHGFKESVPARSFAHRTGHRHQSLRYFLPRVAGVEGISVPRSSSCASPTRVPIAVREVGVTRLFAVCEKQAGRVDRFGGFEQGFEDRLVPVDQRQFASQSPRAVDPVTVDHHNAGRAQEEMLVNDVVGTVDEQVVEGPLPSQVGFRVMKSWTTWAASNRSW